MVQSPWSVPPLVVSHESTQRPATDNERQRFLAMKRLKKVLK
jgi:hypothetical protein